MYGSVIIQFLYDVFKLLDVFVSELEALIVDQTPLSI